MSVVTVCCVAVTKALNHVDSRRLSRGICPTADWKLTADTDALNLPRTHAQLCLLQPGGFTPDELQVCQHAGLTR